MSVVLIVGHDSRVYWVSTVHDILNEHPNICDDLFHAGLTSSEIMRHEPPCIGVARLYPQSHPLSPLYMDILLILDNHCPYLTRRQHVMDVLADIDQRDQAADIAASAPAAPAAPIVPAACAQTNAGMSPCPATYPQNFAALLAPLKPAGQDTYPKSLVLTKRPDYQTLSPPDKLIAFYSGFERSRAYNRAKDRFFVAFAAEVPAGGPMSSVNNSIAHWARLIAREYADRHVRNKDGVIMLRCFEAMGWLDPNLYNGTAAQAAGDSNTTPGT
ncbi:hypothetical protein BDV97DRAFT_176183 [Delphinella strobiligena]|nr:hypothetical protein BDV97DRAFT_176183 [Delphinella strobiligena]